MPAPGAGGRSALVEAAELGRAGTLEEGARRAAERAAWALGGRVWLVGVAVNRGWLQSRPGGTGSGGEFATSPPLVRAAGGGWGGSR